MGGFRVLRIFYDNSILFQLVWTTTIGNFWALRPLTSEMIEFAAADVMVLIPDIYRLQKEYVCYVTNIYPMFALKIKKVFVLFDLVPYIPSTIFQLNRDGSSWVEQVLS